MTPESDAKNLIAQLLESDYTLHEQGDHDIVAAFLTSRDSEMRAEIGGLKSALMEADEDRKDQVRRLCKERDEARAECLEQARLNGMGGERELALMAKLGKAEAELAEERIRTKEAARAEQLNYNSWQKAEAENAALRKERDHWKKCLLRRSWEKRNE